MENNTDWRVELKGEFNEISEKIILGSEKPAFSKEFLNQNGITHIITIGEYLAHEFPQVSLNIYR
jgi:hypothetical protein